MKYCYFLSLLVLFNIQHINAQNCVQGAITFTTQEEINTFSSEYPGCTIIEGNVFIETDAYFSNLTNLEGLSQIEEIQGDLVINDNPLLFSLQGLHNLKRIGGNLKLWFNENIGNLQGIEDLQVIKGNLELRNTSISTISNLSNLDSLGGLQIVFNPLITNLEGFPAIDSLSGDFILQSTPELSDISALNTIKKIEGDIYISESNLTNLEVLQDLSYVGGKLEIRGNPFLSSLADFTQLDSIGGSLIFSSNNLQSLDGLDSLQSIGGDLIISYEEIEDFQSFQNLKSLGGFLTIGGIGKVKTLEDFSNLTKINGIIFISLMDSLQTLHGLDNIDASTIDTILIINNFQLSECNVQSICDYLEINNGAGVIANNLTGCTSTEEVLNACITSVSSEDVTSSKPSLFPNPASQQLFIKDLAPTNSNLLINIHTIDGKRVFQQSFLKGTTEVRINLSHFSKGLYVVRVYQGELVNTLKFIK